MIAMLRALLIFAVAVSVTWASVEPSRAQTWPQRSVKFIVPFGPGAGADIGARLFADRLSRRWGQPVVVENRPGADGIVAVKAFSSANDDHVLFFGPSGSFTVHPFQYDKMPYDPNFLTPIARISNTVIVVTVPASLKIGTLAALVARARAEPGKLNAALVPGITEFVFNGFLNAEKLSMTKVPYRDIVQAGTDLAEGRVQVMMSSLALIQPHVQGGKVKLVAVTGRERIPMAPDVPTAIEAGFPSLELEGLVGVFGPPKMPQALRDRIATDIKAEAADGVIGKRLATTGQIVNIGTGAELAATIDKQRAQVAAVAKAMGMKAAK